VDHKQGNQGREQSAQVPVLYVAFELANSTPVITRLSDKFSRALVLMSWVSLQTSR
jgi:hypothetical protein